MSTFGRSLGLVVAVLMFFFSAFMYRETSDWVPLVFMLGSLGYALLFFLKPQG